MHCLLSYRQIKKKEKNFALNTESPFATYFHEHLDKTPILLLITHETHPFDAQCVNDLPEVYCMQEGIIPDYIIPLLIHSSSLLFRFV